LDAFLNQATPDLNFASEPSGTAALSWETKVLLHFVLGSIHTDRWHAISNLAIPKNCCFDTPFMTAVDPSGDIVAIVVDYLDKGERVEAFSLRPQ
jgi:hypothetical protein